jgi:hypothetical protein
MGNSNPPQQRTGRNLYVSDAFRRIRSANRTAVGQYLNMMEQEVAAAEKDFAN